VLKYFLEPRGITIILLLYFLFITKFESPKTDLPIKNYANCKLRTFQTLFFSMFGCLTFVLIYL
jgi:hypothetical protein